MVAHSKQRKILSQFIDYYSYLKNENRLYFQGANLNNECESFGNSKI